MNHSPSGSLALRKAIIGFTNYKTAEGLTDRSVDSYKRALEQWVAYAGDVEVSQISKQDIEDYLFYLRTEYVPHRFGGDTSALAPKTLRNVYVTLASFFTWASREFRIFVAHGTGMPAPDGSLRAKQVAAVHSAALRKYTRALRRFNAFLVNGELTEDRAAPEL